MALPIQKNRVVLNVSAQSPTTKEEEEAAGGPAWIRTRNQTVMSGFIDPEDHENIGGWRLAPAYDFNPMPVEIKLRILTTAIDKEDGAASLEIALETASRNKLNAMWPAALCERWVPQLMAGDRRPRVYIGEAMSAQSRPRHRPFIVSIAAAPKISRSS
ncbi:hypothetical protein [Bradyrhizobium sp. Cp5.3]|uniref:hypothetical protein n=1 Tax=Bradyrhizobium sp. Cp5.3 TaxID=443598 RepID=UPI0004815162|nr:hypothetical protein [Bradyrhizobium sp. Cp5.3]